MPSRDSAESNEVRLTGIPVSPGIARGKALILSERFEAPERMPIAADDVAFEVERFEDALRRTRRDIVEMQEQIASEVGSGDASIFDAHILMLEDRTVIDEVVRRLDELNVCVEWIFYDVVRRYVDSLRRIGDPYLRERVVDIEDVARRVIRHLQQDSQASGAAASYPHVVFAHDITPSDTATMDRSLVYGFATEAGSHTSHTAIIARSLNIPAVVGLHDVFRKVRTGDSVVVDGYSGAVIVSPDPETLRRYDELEEEKASLASQLEDLRATKCRTADGRDIILSANIELDYELRFIEEKGAEGVGLYRTEFLYLQRRTLPTEEQQLENYTRVAQAAGPDGVIIRTFDLGGDKIDPALADDVEPNPFLGWRGIRVSLARKDVFKPQLRAILRASAHGRVGIMFPFVSCVSELREANGVLAECMSELNAEEVPFDADIEVGAMIEVPSAALMADLLAPHVDFFSIGTNDLIQYTIAVDRVNDRVADLYQPCHPAVIRLLQRIVDAARKNGIWSGVCGEMAGDILYAPIMVGIGIDELSVGAGQLPLVKHAILRLDSAECRGLVEKASSLGEASEIEDLCREMGARLYPELLARTSRRPPPPKPA